MPDFTVRSDSVNVEQIMEQIRARIREKRGVDYTEQQIRELAAVKLEKFLDPTGVRSDLLSEFRRTDPDPNYQFEDDTLYHSSRAPVLRWIRSLLQPVLKLFFNPNPLIHALHIQSKLNDLAASRHQLYYELIHNLVVEATRLGIEVKNLKMKVESLDARVDFAERRARALEGAVVYRAAADPDAVRPATAAPIVERLGPRAAQSTPAPSAASGSPPPPGSAPIGEGGGQRSRRRRRRRGRRGGAPAASIMGGAGQPSPGTPSSATSGASPRDTDSGESGSSASPESAVSPPPQASYAPDDRDGHDDLAASDHSEPDDEQ
jgi:hypothetical protein